MIGWAVHREMLLAGIRVCDRARRVRVSREATELAPLLQRCVLQPTDIPVDVASEPGLAYVLAKQLFGNLVIAVPLLRLMHACLHSLSYSET